jgi:hypothetical protein
LVREHERNQAVSTVEEIKTAIETLPQAEFARLRQWLLERDWRQWDEQVESDSRSGKLDFLISEALKEKANGTLGEL